MADFNDIQGNLALAAGESFRRNAGNSAFEAFVPGSAVSYLSNSPSGDIDLTNAEQWYDTASLTLTTGTWFVHGYCTHSQASNNVPYHCCRITDGSTHYASGERRTHNNADPYKQFNIGTMVVVSGSTLAVKMQSISQTNNVVTRIHAVYCKLVALKVS